MRSGIGRYRVAASVDLLVVGSGLAGLSAAYEACSSGAKVMLVTAGAVGEGASRCAQGGIAIPRDADDVDSHVADTLEAGRGLCDADSVRSIIEEGPLALSWLQGHGMRFDNDCAREGGHSRARVRHREGDRTGAHIVNIVAAALLGHPNAPEVASGHRVVSLCRSGERVTGALVLGPSGAVVVNAGAVVLATGGLGRLYARSSNPAGASGEGVALGILAGAVARDMEFVQFHPTVSSDGVLLTEALRGAGARLVNSAGEYFMRRYEPRAGDLAPRDVVARAVRSEIMTHGAVFLDLGPVPDLDRRFPSLAHYLRTRPGHGPGRQVPVAPAAHYAVGGLKTDLDGRTTLAGLYAAGEVASTGLHGANRLASNSMLEALVMGRRSARATLSGLPAHAGLHRPMVIRGVSPDQAGWMPQAMEAHASVSRNGISLGVLEDRLRSLFSRAEPTLEEAALQTAHRVLVAHLVVLGALLRPESLGVHWREDTPAVAGSAVYHLELSRADGLDDANRGRILHRVCRREDRVRHGSAVDAGQDA